MRAPVTTQKTRPRRHRTVSKLATRLASPRNRSVAVITSGSLTQTLANGVAALVATIVLGPAQRGVMVVAVSVTGIVTLVGCMGTGTTVRTRLPRCVDDNARHALIAAYTWFSLLAVVISATVAVTATALSAPLIDRSMADPGFLVGVAVFTVGQVLVLQSTEAWFGDGRFRRGSVTAATVAVGGLVALLLAAAVHDTAPVLLTAQGLGSIAGWALRCGVLRRDGLMSFTRTAARDVLALVRFGLPTLGLAVGLATALRADRYILGATAGVATVGVYSLAATLSELPRMLPQSFGQLYFRASAVGNGRARLGRWLLLAAGAAAVGGAIIAAIGWLVIVPVFGHAFAASRPLLIVLVVAEVCFAPYAVASRGLLGGGWAKTAGVLGVAATVVALVCYAITASIGGATGAAFGSVLVYGGLSIASWRLLTKRREEALR